MALVCPHCGCKLRGQPSTCKFCGQSTTATPVAPTVVVAPVIKPPPRRPSRAWRRPHAERVPRLSDAELSRVQLPSLPATAPTLGARGKSGFGAFFRRLIGASNETTRAPRRPVGISDGRTFNLSVVGESNYQMSLRRVSNGRRERGEEVVFRVWLVPDVGNPYDANAVAVLLDDGKQVGHLAREWATEFAAPLRELYDDGLAPYCRAKLTGGYAEKAHFGVVLDVRDPREGLIAPF